MPSRVSVPPTSMHDSGISESESLVGSVISGRYRIESLLGEGGMGAVYLAEHTLMRKRLALKVLHPEMTRMPEVVARFEREAMAAAHIEHPNVASATDFGKLDDGSFFLVLEYVEGRGLRQELYGGALEVSRALHIAKQIAAALARAHSLGIVHRDLKPENVMVAPREGDPDFVKVLDFGIAKVPVGQLAGGRAEALTRAGVIFGTPEYMAPEQALGRDVDHRADLYALGVILYEMLSGARPFEADTAVALLGMQVTQAPPSLGRKVPPNIEAIVMRLLAKEPAARFQDAREVIEAMNAALVAEGLATSFPSMLPRPPSPAGALRRHLLQLERHLSRLEPLRAKLPEQLAKLPPVVLLAGGALAFLAVVLLVGRLSSKAVEPRASEASSEGGGLLSLIKLGSQASPAELATAVDAGTDALVELVEKYPSDHEALRALARAQAEGGQLTSAMEAVEKLVAKNAKLADDAEMKELVSQAARSAHAADAAFALLEGPLGSTGVDWLFDLTTTRGVPAKTASRASAALRRPEVRANASPALGIALDLRAATNCQAKKAVLPQAEEQGDARALSVLRPLTSTTGCGFVNKGDCWPCLRDGSLTRTIKAVEERVKDLKE